MKLYCADYNQIEIESKKWINKFGDRLYHYTSLNTFCVW